MEPLINRGGAGRPPVPDPAGALTGAELDANNNAVVAAVTALEVGKLSIDDAQPVTLRATEVVATDDVILLRAGVPYLVAATVLASYFGSAPVATAPAAMTVGQWSAEATATAGQMGINITALPSDGGSAITALEYRVGTGASIALTGTGTGLRVVTAGFTAGSAVDIQVRAVNAVAPGEWSDVKNRTPLAAPVGGGGAAYIGQSSATGATSVTVTAPSGLLPEHTQVAVCMATNASLLPMTAPEGWTLLASHSGGSDAAMAVFTAPGTVSAYAFSSAHLAGVAIVAISGTIRTQSLFARYWGFEGQVHTNPAVTAGAGDLILAVGYQRDGEPTEPVDPQAGYARQYITPGTTPPRLSVVTLADAPAGTTGAISTGAGFNDWSTRYVLTLAVMA